MIIFIPPPSSGGGPELDLLDKIFIIGTMIQIIIFFITLVIGSVTSFEVLDYMLIEVVLSVGWMVLLLSRAMWNIIKPN